jgi:predicted lipoprotein with Yx(FWY)xxD motif
MRQGARFFGPQVVLAVLALGGVGVASSSCSPGVGGIQTQPDGASAAGGRAGAGESGMDGTAEGSGGAPADDAADVGGDGGTGGGGSPECIFHTDPPPMVLPLLETSVDSPAPDLDASDGAIVDAAVPDSTSDDAMITDSASPADVVADRSGRDGGGATDAGPSTSITVLASPFLGNYLADSTGRTLYTFGNDQPGDCNYAPNTDCVADCLLAWPAFDAGQRTLPSTLTDKPFGSITRADGVTFTTYYGWPLYYYRPDTAKGVINGHGKSRTWHVATVVPAGTVIMRKGTEPRYVADGTGRTLYVFDQDTKGTDSTNPVSACVGTCLDSFRPYERKTISVVSSLEATDFTIFVRQDTARSQVAYKGAPLYLSVADSRSGEQNGLATMGWALVAAP